MISYGPSMIVAEDKLWTSMMDGKEAQCIDPTTLQTVNTFSYPPMQQIKAPGPVLAASA